MPTVLANAKVASSGAFVNFTNNSSLVLASSNSSPFEFLISKLKSAIPAASLRTGTKVTV